MNPNLALRSFLFASFVLLGSRLIASEPYEIKTKVGRYRIIEMIDLPGPWEVTTDLKYCVCKTAAGFSAIDIKDGKSVGLSVESMSDEWKVVGQTLIVGVEPGWDIYEIPSMTKVATLPAPANFPDKKQRNQRPVSLARGWYCNGLVYDESATKILANFRSTYGNVDSLSDVRSQNNEYRRSSPKTVFPFGFSPDPREMILQDYDRIPIPMPRFDSSTSRFGEGWMTYLCPSNTFVGNAKTFGCFVQFLDTDYLRSDLQPYPVVALKQPILFLDKDFDKSVWKHEVWPSNYDFECDMTVLPGEDLQSLRNTENSLRNVFDCNSISEAQSRLKIYLDETRPEFEFIVGRPAKEIPVQLTVKLQGSRLNFSYALWTEMTEAELFKRYGREVVAREQAALKEKTASDAEKKKTALDAQRKKIEYENKRFEAQEVVRKSAPIIIFSYLRMISCFFAIGVASFGGIWLIRRLDRKKIASQKPPKLMSEPPKLMIALILLGSCFTSGPLFAQSEWTIQKGSELFPSLLSIQEDGKILSVHCGLFEETIVVHVENDQSQRFINSYELGTLKQRSSIPEPPGWNSQMVSFGTRYGCSTSGRQLTIIDLQQGKVIGTFQLRSPAIPQILFDKAVWLDQGQLIAIPAMKEATSHPLVDRSVATFDQPDGPKSLPWRRTKETWIVNGLSVGKDLKPGSLFLGNFLHKGVTLNQLKEFKSGLRVSPTDARDVTIDTNIGGNQLVANLKVQSPLGNGEQLLLYHYDRGYYGHAGNLLVSLNVAELLYQPSKNGSSEDLIIPPLLRVDGSFRPVLTESGEKVNKGFLTKELNSISSIELQFDDSKEKLELGLSDKGKTACHSPQVLEQIAKRVIARAQVGPDATPEQILSAYMANIQNWLLPYQASLHEKIAGVPVEFPHRLGAGIDYYSSVVIEVPREELMPHLVLKTRKYPPEKFQADPKGLDSLEKLATSEQSTEMPTITVPPAANVGLEEPLPERINPAVIQGEFKYVERLHGMLIKLFTVRIVLYFFLLLVSVFQFSRVIGRNVRLYGNSLVTALLVAVACVTLDLAFTLTVDLLTEPIIGKNAQMLLVRGTVKLLFALITSFAAYSLAIEGNLRDKAGVFLVSTILYVLFIVSLFYALLTA